MHTARPGVTLPYMTPADVKASAQAMTTLLPSLPGKERLPAVPGRDLLFYGGLGALAVAGALEWPVALAIGGATYVVRGRTRQETETQPTKRAESRKAGPAKTTTTRRRGTTAQRKS